MRQIQTATAIALIVTVIAILGVSVINAKSSKQVAIVPVSNSIDVMRMMNDAKDLPIQQFDAH